MLYYCCVYAHNGSACATVCRNSRIERSRATLISRIVRRPVRGGPVYCNKLQDLRSVDNYSVFHAGLCAAHSASAVSCHTRACCAAGRRSLNKANCSRPRYTAVLHTIQSIRGYLHRRNQPCFKLRNILVTLKYMQVWHILAGQR